MWACNKNERPGEWFCHQKHVQPWGVQHHDQHNKPWNLMSTFKRLKLRHIHLFNQVKTVMPWMQIAIIATAMLLRCGFQLEDIYLRYKKVRWLILEWNKSFNRNEIPQNRKMDKGLYTNTKQKYHVCLELYSRSCYPKTGIIYPAVEELLKNRIW